MSKEIRAFNFDIRTEHNDDKKYTLRGRPIVFNADTDMGYYTERISSNALDNTDLKDVRFLINHNTEMIPLARSRNNNANSTMQMEVDAEGMNIRVELDVDNNAEAKALYSAIERGDISGMSFMFTVNSEEWSDVLSDKPTRTITEIGKVFEVSAVTFPAYSQTSIATRGLDDALESAKQTLESERTKARQFELQKAKIKLKMEI